MKILSIAGRNLNSLRVDFKVDFTSGVLKDCGIFAITGPTGAGKTTLLDTITLALYGKTPRSATDEDIISYGAGEAWAEVIFQTSEGCFKSEWKVRRARSKHDGALQQSSMEVSTYPDGRILTQKKREAQDKVKELIKLEYEQFLKSVLLAQGAFKAFLDAKEGERGEMLEKISDTSLYATLSKRAFERKKKEEQQLDVLRASVGNVVLLTDEERSAYVTNIDTLKEEELTQQKDLSELQVKLNWLKMISDLTQRQLAAEHEVALSQQKLEQERPHLRRWEAHQQVATLELQWLQLQSKKDERIIQAQNIKKLRDKLLLLSQRVEQAGTLLGMAQKQLEAAVQNREEKMPVILGAITRLADLKTEKKQLVALQEKLQAKFLEESNCKARILKNETTLVNDKKVLAVLETWLNEHLQYAEAADSCTQASRLVSQLERSKEDIELYQATIIKADKQLSAAKENILAAEKNKQNADKEQQLLTKLHDTTAKDLTKLKSQLVLHAQENNLLFDNAVELSDAHQNELSRQEFLAEHLSRLHEGEACPLCGSTEHPNQTLTIGDVQKQIRLIQTELNQHRHIIKTNKTLQKTIDKLMANLEDYSEPDEVNTERLPQNFEVVFNELIKLQKSIPQKQNDALMLAASAKQLIDNLTANIVDLESRKTETIKKLALVNGTFVFQIKALNEIAIQYHLQFDLRNPAALPEVLRKYSEEYHKKTKEESVLKGTIPGIQSGIDTLKEQISGLQKDMVQFQQEIDEKSALILRYTEEIQTAHTGYATPEAARDHLIANEKQANDQEKLQGEQLNKLKHEIGKINGEVESNEKTMQELERMAESLVTSLKAGLVALGLEENLTFIEENLLGTNERLNLGRLYKILHDKLTLAAAQAESCRNQLELQKSLEVTSEDADSISGKMSAVSIALKAMNEKIGEMKQILKDDDAKQLKIQFVKKQIETQEKVFQKWASLSALIGSESGKKFNQFAQGLTLDRLIVISNHHLQLLNDRYLLKRNTMEQGLRLLVVDKYQADNEREINTLSGGESFLVSLALALGLSEMTSKLTTIDSLFIDEGFGTLDADTLEVALSALRGLQIGGKTIGIISHVERLKEEIYTQVEIRKGADGFSTLKVIPEIV